MQEVSHRWGVGNGTDRPLGKIRENASLTKNRYGFVLGRGGVDTQGKGGVNGLIGGMNGAIGSVSGRVNEVNRK